MAKPHVAPYGSWKSPLTSDMVAAGMIRPGQIALDGKDIYWVEMRPAEGGRYVVVKWSPDGKITDITPSTFNARTRVHEYGGGSFTVIDGTVYFSNFTDQRLYRQDGGGKPEAITPEGDMRYADGIIDRRRNRMVCVREDHTAAGEEAVNTLVSIGLDGDSGRGGDAGTVLVCGSDFYSSPRLNPDGSCLAWLTWNHPNMPWDGTELWIGELKDDGSMGRVEKVAGGNDESIFQPEWSPGGVLHFISDRTGWWNIYRFRDGRIEPMTGMEAEFGAPQWFFGMSTYAFESDDRIICACTNGDRWRLAGLNTVSRRLEPIKIPYSDITYVRAAPGCAIFVGGSPTEQASIIRLSFPAQQVEVLRRFSNITIGAGYLSIPRAIEFPTENGLTSHAFFYQPQNRDFAAPQGERPPLLVISHGGPTSAATSMLNPMIQFWTSRGIAVIDVNYGGSTGFGRDYRQRLYGQWGVVDVDDCVNGARYLAGRGEVDGDRLAIRGGSAGGYTTLCALTFRNVFKAGASYYGVSDLEAMRKETHKFESHYLDRLIAPYPERRDLYLTRSPIRSIDRLSCPVIFFQGLEDRVVPPDQTEIMFEAVKARGLPTAYLAFEGEQHGFRRAGTIRRALDAELYFYSKVFGFELADFMEPVKIENL